MNPCISTPVPSGVDVLFLPDGLELQESYTLLFLWGTCPCVCCLNEREELPPLPDDASGVLLSFSPSFLNRNLTFALASSSEYKTLTEEYGFVPLDIFTDRGGAFDGRIPLSASLAQRMREDLALIFDLALTRKDRRWSCRSRQYLTVILESLHHCYELQYPPSSRPAASSPAVLDILMYIHAHFDEELSLERLSSEFHLGKSALCRRFKMATGRSVGQYILSYRLSCAAYSLATTALSVSEVAHLCGFQSSAYFSRCFRACYGMPPGQYREEKLQARRRDFGVHLQAESQ